MAINVQKFSGALQENILTLLCFDTDACPIIIAAVDISLFESVVYRTIAERSIKYFRKYKKAPAEHLPDLVEEFLNSPKRSEIRLYTEALHDLHDLSEGINKKFVLDELQQFVRQQSLRQSITFAAEELQRGRLDSAEKELLQGIKKRMTVFEKGLTISEAIESSVLYESQSDLIRTGIKPFDDDGVCPAPGELFTVMALANRGKTWWLQSIGKYAALQRKKVLHISLEMNEEKIARRYVQSFFSMTRRPESFSVPVIKSDDKNRFIGLSMKRMRKRPSLIDPTTKRKLIRRKETFGKKFDRILVKQFPTGLLTIDGLRAYLEMLEQQENFLPDLMIVDYADLMKMDYSNIRVETGGIYRDLRGIAVERNLAVATASQSNRSGEDARLLTMKHFAEDYSKAGTSDNILTYNQTTEEKELGLARLFSLKARDERSGHTVLITQAYSSGQFALDALRLYGSKKYWEEVDRKKK